MRSKMNSVLLLLCFVFLTGNAYSASSPSELFSKIHQANVLEVKAGEIASQKAKHKDVKNYAMELRIMHKIADQLVLTWSKTRKIELINLGASVEDEEMMNKIQNASDSEFDLLFLGEMKKAHKKLIMELEENSKIPNPSQIDSYLLSKSLLPIFKNHLQKARSLELRIKFLNLMGMNL